MKVVLFASRAAPELFPLTNNRNCAALPVGGKPLIVHAVESLAMAGLKEATIVISPPENDLRRTLGDGARWGMQFDYLPVLRSESSDETVRGLRAKSSDDFLVVRGEILRTPIIEEFLARIPLIEASIVAATIAGVPAGVRLVRRSAVELHGLPDGPANHTEWRESVAALEFPDAAMSLIESLAAFHQANLRTISGQFPGLIVPGRRLMPGVTVGRGTRLPARAVKGESIFVGAQCQVAANAELMSDVVVSDNVVIDRRATIRSAVIMPDSYVGQLVEVSDAIVDGDTLIDIDTGVVTRVTDSFLLTSVRAHSIASYIRSLVDRASVAFARLRPLKWLKRPEWLRFETTDRIDLTKSGSVHAERVENDESIEERIANDLERNHIGGGNGHAALSSNARSLQATRTDLRQTYDLLSARGPNDGRDP